jgi:hypothetical protein
MNTTTNSVPIVDAARATILAECDPMVARAPYPVSDDPYGDFLDACIAELPADWYAREKQRYEDWATLDALSAAGYYENEGTDPIKADVSPETASALGASR